MVRRQLHLSTYLAVGALLAATLACNTLITPEAPQTGRLPAGLSRAQPYTLNDIAASETLTVQVLRQVRGDAAWDMLYEANPRNTPPPEGWHYIMAEVTVECRAAVAKCRPVFGLTGSYNVDRLYASAVAPSRLDYELAGGARTQGWSVHLTPVDETQLLLTFRDFAAEELAVRMAQRYIALDAGAQLFADLALDAIAPTTLGQLPDAPVPLEQTAITEDWEVTVLEVLTGAEAWEALLAANQFNKPPAEGMTYVLLSLRARYIGIQEGPVHIGQSEFRLRGGDEVLYPLPALVEPEPKFNLYLYPGGMDVGWLALEVDAATPAPLLYFKPVAAAESEVRYFSLEP